MLDQHRVDPARLGGVDREHPERAGVVADQNRVRADLAEQVVQPQLHVNGGTPRRLCASAARLHDGSSQSRQPVEPNPVRSYRHGDGLSRVSAPGIAFGAETKAGDAACLREYPDRSGVEEHRLRSGRRAALRRIRSQIHQNGLPALGGQLPQHR